MKYFVTIKNGSILKRDHLNTCYSGYLCLPNKRGKSNFLCRTMTMRCWVDAYVPLHHLCLSLHEAGAHLQLPPLHCVRCFQRKIRKFKFIVYRFHPFELHHLSGIYAENIFGTGFLCSHNK